LNSSIQQEVGITFIYVTHDQGEALTMSDRLAVFNHGHIEQVGAPAEVYEKPATPFVAGFVGTSNLLKGDLAGQITGSPGTYTVRPEKIRVTEPDEQPGADESSALGTIDKVVYLGPETRLIVGLEDGTQLVVMQQNLTTESGQVMALEGKRVRLTWKRVHNLALAAVDGG
jgi:putative spermidine/putrescine transport system ATP-binding protein